MEIEYRNPVIVSDSVIDCEINHPDYGWIPFTASASDPMSYGRELYEIILKTLVED